MPRHHPERAGDGAFLYSGKSGGRHAESYKQGSRENRAARRRVGTLSPDYR